MIVADTNVVSQAMKVRPSPAVRAWVFAHGHDQLRMAAITVAGTLHGVERHPIDSRNTALPDAAVEIFSRFAEDVMPFDSAAATLFP